MKYTLLIAFVLLTGDAFSQVLTFKSVSTSRSSDYQDFAALLGKTITVKVYDNAISLTIQGDKTPIYLQKTEAENQYSGSLYEGYNHPFVTVNLYYKIGVLSSLEFEVDNVGSSGRLESYKKAVAKRF